MAGKGGSGLFDMFPILMIDGTQTAVLILRLWDENEVRVLVIGVERGNVGAGGRGLERIALVNAYLDRQVG
jgi:hypothetical protein